VKRRAFITDWARPQQPTMTMPVIGLAYLFALGDKMKIELGCLIAALLLAIPPVANAEAVRVNVFPVSQNLPVLVAQAKGLTVAGR